MAKYKQHTAEFKMKVALEAAKGIDGINDIGGQYGIHPKQVSEWKKRLIENAELIFDKRPKEEDQASKTEADLLKKVGQLSMEIDWLKKNCRRIHIFRETRINRCRDKSIFNIETVRIAFIA